MSQKKISIILSILLMFLIPVSCINDVVRISTEKIQDIYKFEKKQAYYHDWNYVYSYAYCYTHNGIRRNDDKTASMIADTVMKYAIKYKLDPQIVARKIWKETWYYQWAQSYVIDDAGKYILDAGGKAIPIARGLAQINMDANWKIVTVISDGKYKVRAAKKQDAIYLLWNMDINIETGCYILSNYLDDYKIYELALTAYWAGQNSGHFKKLLWRGVRNQYIDEILNPAVFEYNAALYHGWTYIERKNWLVEPDPFSTNAIANK